MKDSTRVRRLTKIWAAFNDGTISAKDAVAKIYKLGYLLLNEEQAKEVMFKFHSDFPTTCKNGWNIYMGLTDDARVRWLKEILP